MLKGKTLKGDLASADLKDRYGSFLPFSNEKGDNLEPYFFDLLYGKETLSENNRWSEAEAEDCRSFEGRASEINEADVAAMVEQIKAQPMLPIHVRPTLEQLIKATSEDLPLGPTLELQIIYGGRKGCFVKVEPASQGKVRVRLISQFSGAEVLEDRVIAKTELCNFLDMYQAY